MKELLEWSFEFTVAPQGDASFGSDDAEDLLGQITTWAERNSLSVGGGFAAQDGDVTFRLGLCSTGERLISEESAQRLMKLTRREVMRVGAAASGGFREFEPSEASEEQFEEIIAAAAEHARRDPIN